MPFVTADGLVRVRMLGQTTAAWAYGADVGTLRRSREDTRVMALNAYLRLEGETQGSIKGSSTQAGREDLIQIIAFDHEVDAGLDAFGQPTGKRRHGLLSVTKELDRSTPMLMTALTSDEPLGRFELRFWQPSRTGQEEQHYTIRLRSAKIAAIRAEMLNNKYPEHTQHKEREHVLFAYSGIEWTWEDGGVTATDQWPGATGTLHR